MSAPPAQQILTHLRRHRDEMADLLQRLALAESPSLAPAAQEAVLALLTEALSALDYTVRRMPGRTSGGYLYASPRERVRHRPGQLMLGHCDTVWPLGILDEMPVAVEGDVLSGPGVFDMKGGLVQMIYALHALRALRLDPPLTPLALINSDEEIGSRDSTPAIRLLARTVCRVFVLEPALGLSGKLKVARKGVGRFTVVVKSADSGRPPLQAKTGAILELSHLIQKLFALNDPQQGITVNVGMIDSGLAGAVAAESRAIVDVRVPTQAAARQIEEAILGLTPTTTGVVLEIEGGVRRPPMERTPGNQMLWRLASSLADELGLALEGEMAGGGSDGNTTSLFTATLDGLGAVGDGAHARHEFIYLDKMVERSALLALLLLAPP